MMIWHLKCLKCLESPGMMPIGDAVGTVVSKAQTNDAGGGAALSRADARRDDAVATVVSMNSPARSVRLRRVEDQTPMG